MAQTYKMKLGTSGKQWEQLTVKDDGTMTMTFHGTDREICHEVTENADGWLCYPGAMFPGLESGKWQLMDDGRCKMEDGRGKMDDVVETTDCADSTDNEPEVIEEATDYTDLEPAPVYTDNAELEQLRAENQRLQEQIAQMSDIRCMMADDCNATLSEREPLTVNPDCNATLSEREPLTINQPRPRRQRKQRKPRVERQPSDISPQPSATLKAIGMVAAATVALLVIYETGLLIPLGLIGLATSGLLK